MPCSSCRSSQAATTVRTGAGQWIAEAVAAFGLVFTILAGLRFRPDAIPWLVGLYITAAYWFTASTSFANPAVAIARAFSDTFAGIRPVDLPGFIAAELARRACSPWRSPAGCSPSRDRIAQTLKACRMTITIYHNPECGTSRNTLAMIRQSGEEPEVIEYLKTPPSRERLRRADRGDGHHAARAAAREGHALCRAWPRRSEMERRRADRLHAGASDPDQPADRGDAARRACWRGRPRPCSTSCPIRISVRSPRKTARSSSTQAAGAASLYFEYFRNSLDGSHRRVLSLFP